MNEWHERLDELKRSCERLDALIKDSGYEYDDSVGYFEIGPPAKESDILETEKRLAYRIPSSFRNVLLEFSGSFKAGWGVPRDAPINMLYETNGYCYWNLDLLVSLNECDYKIWHEEAMELKDGDEEDVAFSSRILNGRFWYDVPNGDLLSIGIGDEDSQEIRYLEHDGGFFTYLAENFEDFIDRWMKLAFIGPEIWHLESYCDENGLMPDGEKGRTFQEWFYR